MGARFYTSDPHFGHRFLAIDIRGFDSVEEHDAQLIENWNKTVKPEDMVIVAGDYSLRNPTQPNWPDVNRLNGTKILVEGNHDACWAGHRDARRMHQLYVDAGFSYVTPFMRIKLDGNPVLISHFPYDGDHTADERYEQYRLRDLGLPLIHGHTHSSIPVTYSDKNSLQIHVGMDANDLTPVHESKVIGVIQLHQMLQERIVL